MMLPSASPPYGVDFDFLTTPHHVCSLLPSITTLAISVRHIESGIAMKPQSFDIPLPMNDMYATMEVDTKMYHSMLQREQESSV